MDAGGILVMKKKLQSRRMQTDAVVFMPALTPLEASVLPALEALERKKPYGTLSMVRRAYDAGDCAAAQRTKIWVR